MTTTEGYYYSKGGLDFRDKLMSLVFEYVENGGASAKDLLTILQSTFPDDPELNP
jgi:hypothetical protein